MNRDISVYFFLLFHLLIKKIINVLAKFVIFFSVLVSICTDLVYGRIIKYGGINRLCMGCADVD